MTIYCDPYPLNGIDDATKFVVDELLQLTERHDPGFCSQNGIQLEHGRLPSGPKVKHQRIIRDVWPEIPDSVKNDFLCSQYATAVQYLNRCVDAFEAAGVNVPAAVRHFGSAPAAKP